MPGSCMFGALNNTNQTFSTIPLDLSGNGSIGWSQHEHGHNQGNSHEPIEGQTYCPLLHMIAAEIRVATGAAHAAAKAARTNAKAGRVEEAMQSILEAEPKLYDAQKLLSLATYVNQIGRYQKGDS